MGILLRQIFEKPISGYWDGGKKQVFDWIINHNIGGQDAKGEFVRIGSWSANHWFHVALGETDKQTLSYAKRRLSHSARINGQNCKFEYIEEGKNE